MKLLHPVSLGTLLVATTWAQSVAMAHPPACFGAIDTGKFSLYHNQNGVDRTDLSGVATDGKNIIMVDDGGDPGPGFGFNFVRVATDVPDTDAYNIPLTLQHDDVEAATYANGWFYITTSMATTSANQRRLTRFRLDAENRRLLDEQSVDLRDSLLEALRLTFGDEWYDSWKNRDERAGGLNIEGLSRSHTGEDAVVFGIRGPQFGGNFPNDLVSGNAILAKVKNPFGANPTWDFTLADLDGFGVRGFEWIPKLHSYVVIGGPLERGNTYGLFRVFPNGDAERLDLPGFSTLCRPESVFQQTKNGKDYLVVTSEDSAAACAGTPFTFIRAEIKPGAGHCK